MDDLLIKALQSEAESVLNTEKEERRKARNKRKALRRARNQAAKKKS
jgi:hypothetical protein